MAGRRNSARLAALVVLAGAGVSLGIALAMSSAEPPLPSSLAPAFQLFGTPVKLADHFVTRIIPINALDERDLGNVLRARWEAQADSGDPDARYLNEILSYLARRARKPFEYRVYVVDGARPNAMALPGGTMLATRALLASMHSEAEIASVLAHEMGHIEQGHCVDAVKFALLADKAGARPIGEIVDLALRLLTAHSFSKTQEDAADQYAYAMLEDSPYDPHGVGNAFASLLRFQGERRPGQADPRGADPLRDYFSSHPPLEIREATFRERAAAWWRRNPDEKRTLGADNLLERVSVYRIQDAGTSAAR